ncbi:hypothetical protein HMPREF1316_0686 [Olsenella profusa F0195]|uniref:Uncharacterized protein n=1 Tax=Olsenella profusa F0195 TaxID=1125712 RepID=U2SZ89_9ACTN|nr:hypothetical protein HMPREF1316_0686 [Olsenella profusa F0195]
MLVAHAQLALPRGARVRCHWLRARRSRLIHGRSSPSFV